LELQKKEENHAIYQELIAVLKAISGLWANNPDVEKIFTLIRVFSNLLHR